MSRWLLVSDPDDYHWSQLFRKAKESWDGVRGALALKHMREMISADPILCYHSGKEKSVFAIAKAVGPATPDLKDKTGKLFTVEVTSVRKLSRPIMLTEIKKNPRLARMQFLVIPRLSISRVTDEEWDEILRMTSSPAASPLSVAALTPKNR